MTNSIFLTIKKMLGIAEEYHAFDLDIITHINSVFLTLNQLGIGPATPYQIIDDKEIWDDFQGENPIPGVQSYIYLKTRLLFDPPTNSFLVDNMQKQIAEFEWRMNVQVETPYSEPKIKESGYSTTTVSAPTNIQEAAILREVQDPKPVAILRDKIIATMNQQSHLKGG